MADTFKNNVILLSLLYEISENYFFFGSAYMINRLLDFHPSTKCPFPHPSIPLFNRSFVHSFVRLFSVSHNNLELKQTNNPARPPTIVSSQELHILQSHVFSSTLSKAPDNYDVITTRNCRRVAESETNKNTSRTLSGLAFRALGQKSSCFLRHLDSSKVTSNLLVRF